MQSYQLGKRFSNLAAQLAGGKAYFRIAGTTNAATMYADPDLTEEHAYPIVADGYGNFPETVYHDGTQALRLDVIASDGDLASPLAQSEQINTPQSAGSFNGADITEATIPGSAFEPGAVEDYLGFTPQEALIALSDAALNTLLRRRGTEFTAMTETAPAGSLQCDGTAVSRTTYALLWAWVQANGKIAADATDHTNNPGKWYVGDGSTTFNLPDYRGLFPRVWDDAKGVDSGRVLGTSQADAVGPVTISALRSTNGGAANDSGTPANIMTDSDGAGAANTTFITATNTAAETRPKNYATNVFVWY